MITYRPALLLTGIILLQGCATTALQKPSPSSTLPATATVVPAPAPAPVVVHHAPVSTDAANAAAKDIPPSAPTDIDPWDRVRRGLAFADCDDSPLVKRWIRLYLGNTTQLIAMLRRPLPGMLWVLERLEKDQLPTEFVFLPLVESQYTAVRGQGNRPAGWWQFMPATARHFGLAIGPSYDGRLDLAASTRAASAYLSDMGGRFDRDWPLVDMAFNAGEYRVRRAYRAAQQRYPDPRPTQLAVSPITHAHLARLQALACIVRDAEIHGLDLPTLHAGDALHAVALDSDLDLSLAATLAGVDERAFRALNAGPLVADARAGTTLLVPQSHAITFVALLGELAPPQRTGWSQQRLRTPATWNALAARSGIAPNLLARLNQRSDVDPVPTVGAAVLIPDGPFGRDRSAVETRDAGDGNGYIVRAGDSLWRIARRLGVSVGELVEWNRIAAGTTLRPGQILRLAPSD